MKHHVGYRGIDESVIADIRIIYHNMMGNFPVDDTFEKRVIDHAFKTKLNQDIEDDVYAVANAFVDILYDEGDSYD